MFRNLIKSFHQLASTGKNMKVLKTSEDCAIKVASKLLGEEGIIISIPTDTIYGLACNANDHNAIKRLYEIKGRNEEKPVAICVSDYGDLKHWGTCSFIIISHLFN